jgi:uncharacterized radical SAM superfamily Fe-S cluster-containing enzyme
LKIFSTGISVDRVEDNMKQLLCCLPQIHAPGLAYENLFRIIIMRFIDAYDFDVRAIKKSCVHIVHKDGRIIPFETMNLFYRDEKEANIKELRSKHQYPLSKTTKYCLISLGLNALLGILLSIPFFCRQRWSV